MANPHPTITFQVNLQTVNWESHLVPDRHRQDQDAAIDDLNNQSNTRTSTILINGRNLKHGDKFTLYGQEAIRYRSIANAGGLPIIECSNSEDVNCVPDIGEEADVDMTATATATMLPQGSVVVASGGTGGYLVSDVLTLVGGTFSTVAQITVSTIGTVLGQDETSFTGGEFTGTFVGGTGHSVSDTITLTDGTVVTVAAEAAGEVTEFDITTASTSGSGSDWPTLTQSSTSGGGSGFSLTLDDDNQAVFAGAYVQASEVNVGEYSIIPSNPVSSTGASGGGISPDDATFTVTWGVRNVTVTDGGNNYNSAPTVSFSGAGGSGTTATATLDGDSVDAIVVTASGSGYTVVATVTIDAP